MAKWEYVGPSYARGFILPDTTRIYPAELSDAEIDDLLTEYPRLATLFALQSAGSSVTPSELYTMVTDLKDKTEPLGEYATLDDAIADGLVVGNTFIINNENHPQNGSFVKILA